VPKREQKEDVKLPRAMKGIGGRDGDGDEDDSDGSRSVQSSGIEGMPITYWLENLWTRPVGLHRAPLVTCMHCGAMYALTVTGGSMVIRAGQENLARMMVSTSYTYTLSLGS
jgi:hypothetical protein